MRNGNRCEGVIFDMDGVLIDSHPVHKKAWSRFLASLNKPVSEEELDFVTEGRKREEILCHFLGELSPKQIQEYGRLKNDLYSESEGDLQVIPGVVEFLDALQVAGIRMAVATSASSGRAHGVLDRLGLLSRFRAVVTASDVDRGKPDPEIFVQAAERLELIPQNVLVVEDAVSGVKGAKSAGMKCLGIAGNGRRDKLRYAGADCVITDYRQINLSQVQQLF
jgi:beta-phosphoglucomutase family hydrolase